MEDDLRRRYISLYRSYTLKNAICISESEDIYHYGYQVCTLVESDYARQYREKYREQCKAWYERKKAERLAQGIPAPERKKPVCKPRFTEEERKERNRQRSLEYYHAHWDECNRKKRERYQRSRKLAEQFRIAIAEKVEFDVQTKKTVWFVRIIC